jgi:predicted MFS family arabinose efflux permease
MYILVTSDISGGTGRFSMTLGLTTAAMSIGGTVSGYLGEALAQDVGYKQAFFILCLMSLVPALLYLFFMPETLPALVNKTDPRTLGSIQRIQEETNEDGDHPVSYAEMT